MVDPDRRLVLLLVGVATAVAIAIPVTFAQPLPSAGPAAQTKPAKAAKPDKGAEVAITVQGTVKQAADGKGRPTFSLTSEGKTWDLSAGPAWFWGDKNPLKAYVEKSVSVTGSYRAGTTELDVTTIDGKALREDGKPPWAGGKQGKGLGQRPPGQTKDKATDDD